MEGWAGWDGGMLSGSPALDGDGTGGYWLQIPGTARNWRRVRDTVTVENNSLISFQAVLALLIHGEAGGRWLYLTA